MSDDTAHMRQALALARKGVGRTAPNPAVGCVIVREGRVVGTGWHRRAGTPHAEIHALAMAGELARGADLYVTLEPCCHTGKTPPCSEAVIRAGVGRVVAGMADPNPRVAGGGLARLKAAGIRVECGLLEEECRELNRPFLKWITTGMPLVTYKCAMTLDGKTATRTGASRWVSCPESRRYVHRMRSRMDAIMVGVDTVIADDPELTVRHVRGKNPLRVVVDSRLRTPGNARLLDATAAPTLLATLRDDPRARSPFRERGATLLVCDEEKGRVSLTNLLRRLGERGVQSLLLEGGSRLAGSMLEQGLIDEFVFFLAPKLLGSDGFSPFHLEGRLGMEQADRLQITRVCRSGCDIVVHARPEASCSPA